MIPFPFQFGSFGTILSSGGGGASSTQWRVYITENQNGGVTSAFKEVEMKTTIGGADACTGGTASADSTVSAAADAFDDSSATLWQSGFGAVPHWIQYTFSSAVTIVQITLKTQTGDTGPKGWKFEYWDGGAWIAVKTVTAEPAWGDAELRTYTL